MPDPGKTTDLEVTSRSAAFVEGLDHRALPLPVRRECLRALVNAVGCLVGGAGHEMTGVISGALLEHAGAPVATLLGQGRKTDVLTAALVNGLSGASYSFDDTYGEAMLHPSVPILAAMFALAEWHPVSGKAFLGAYAGALEVSCRLTRALTVTPAVPEMAWSQTGIVAGIGAALACGKLLSLNGKALETALGIALSEAAGTRAAHGSMTASLIFGRAAQSGLRAALLASQGFTATPGAIEHAFGFARVFTREAHLQALVAGLGTHFELMSNTYKPYPCGVVIHPAIDGVLDLRRVHGFTPEMVERIVLEVSPRAMELAFRPDPATDIEAKVSLHHWVAVAAATGRAGVAEGRLAVVTDPAIAAMRSRIDAVDADDLPATAARVSIRLRDRRVLAHSVQSCSGSHDNPMTDEQITEKCRQQAAMTIGAGRAEALTAICWEIESLSDAADLVRAAA